MFFQTDSFADTDSYLRQTFDNLYLMGQMRGGMCMKLDSQLDLRWLLREGSHGDESSGWIA